MSQPQHDAHAVAFDVDMWERHLNKQLTQEVSALTAPEPEEELRYLIGNSDSIENLYWSPDGWGALSEATTFTREEVIASPEPVVDGFWMPLSRAEELEL